MRHSCAPYALAASPKLLLAAGHDNQVSLLQQSRMSAEVLCTTSSYSRWPQVLAKPACSWLLSIQNMTLGWSALSSVCLTE